MGPLLVAKGRRCRYGQRKKGKSLGERWSILESEAACRMLGRVFGRFEKGTGKGEQARSDLRSEGGRSFYGGERNNNILRSKRKITLLKKGGKGGRPALQKSKESEEERRGKSEREKGKKERSLSTEEERGKSPEGEGGTLSAGKKKGERLAEKKRRFSTMQKERDP